MTPPVLQPGITLLEASAGTGKTFRIAHTVLRLVAEEDLSIGAIVVVTFTEAATGELRDRVRKRLRDAVRGLRARADGAPWNAPDDVLEQWVADAPDDELAVRHRRVRTALVDFDEALISTIHGFCNAVLRRNAFESGASFGAEVVAGVGDLLEDLALDFWSRLVHDAHPSLRRALNGAGVTRKRLLDLAEKAADPDREVIPPPPPGADLSAELPDLSAWQAAFGALVAAWQPREIWDDAFSDGDVTIQSRRYGPVAFPRGETTNNAWSVGRQLWKDRPAPHDELPRKFALFAPSRIAAATFEGKTPPTSAALDALAAFIAVHQAVQPAYAAVIQGAKFAFVDTVRAELRPLVRRRNLRTYDDLLVDLRDALRRTGGTGGPLQEAVLGRYEVALIDEFQDTDPVQWEIFETLFPQRLCLIGDPKQAIYSFRGADVFTYRRAGRSVQQRAELDRNFRTDKLLVDAVVALFDRDEPFAAADPPCPPVDSEWRDRRLSDVPPLGGGDPDPDPRPPLEIRFLPRDGAQLNDKDLLDWHFLHAEMPRIVAEDIARELARGRCIREDDGWRPVRPGHCAVLTRTNEQAADVQRALRTHGIPSVIKSTESVLKSTTAGELRTVLEAILEPTSPAAVRRALTTNLMGRDATALVALEDDAGSFASEVAPFYRWHAAWIEEGFARMFRAFLDDDGVRARLLAREGGERELTNLVHLGEELAGAAAKRRLGPAGLQAWLAAGGPGLDDDAAGQRLESDADAVRISTLHSAKGLEWPLVWCPHLWHTFGVGKDDAAHLVFHDPDDDLKAKLDIGSARHDDHLRRARLEKFQEELRTVYVALTRARHRTVAYHGGVNPRAALAYLLHARTEAATDVLQYGCARIHDDDDICEDLLAAQSNVPGLAVTKVNWSSGPVPTYTPDPGGATALAARQLTRERAPDVLWRRTSFTDLTRRGGEPRDRDGDPAGDADATAAPTAAGDSRPVVLGEDFPRGRAIGNLVHEILELHDFEARDALEPLVRGRLAARGFDEALVDPMTSGLALAIDTPMDASGVRLRDLSRAQRLDELEFWLPVQGGFEPTGGLLTPKSLAGAFALATDPTWAVGIGEIPFTNVRGFMKGAIDLVFEHGGRYFVVDYKSNWRGATYGDYERSRLDEPMAEANYVLQYHLYTLALHRYLRWRLGPEVYDYDRHVGGVRYLFVRGMRPDLGPSHGVFDDRPPAAMIEELDRVVGGTP